MNASRLRQCFVCSDIDRVGCSYISALLQPILPLRAPMKSADSHLIAGTSSKLGNQFRFSESRSDLSCHLTRLPTQLFDIHPVLNGNLAPFGRRSDGLHAHVPFFIRSVMSEHRPDRARHLVRQSSRHHVGWSPFFHLLNPRARLT